MSRISRSLSRLAVFASLAAAAGCTGGSYKATAIISDVEPNRVAAGRSITVEIVGDFTKWKESSLSAEDVRFGDGIAVNAVTVANAGLLYAEITAAPDAVPGARDVEVDGELALGVFEVVLPFEILTPTITAGGYAFLEIVGNDTNWLDGLTGLEIAGGEVVTDGSDFFGATGFSVLAPNYIVAVVKPDLFATAGAVDVTINGTNATDTVPALSIAAPAFTVLDTDANAAGVVAGPSEVLAFSVSPGAVGDSFTFGFEPDGTSDDVFALVYDEDDGRNPIAYLDVFEDPFEQFSFGSSKEVYILLQEFTLAGGGVEWEYDVTFDSLDPAQIADELANQELAAAGDVNWYYFDTTRWNLATVDVTAESMTPTIVPALTVLRDGGLAEFTVAASSSNLTTSFLSVPGGNVIVGVADDAGASSGADSAYTIGFTDAAIGDALTASGQTGPLTIPEDGTPIELTLDPATGFTSLTAVHLLVDIRHPYRGDLYIELTSPSGITEPVVFDSFDGTDDWVTAFPLLTPEDGDFSAFTAEANPDGVWTLYIEDTYAYLDNGRIEGWALAFEGS